MSKLIVNAKRTRRIEDHSYLWKAGDVAEVRVEGKIDFCCDEMRSAWNDRAVGFGEYDTMLNKSADINIYTCSPYPEGAVWDEYAIRFCPFCSAGVEVRVIESASAEGQRVKAQKAPDS